MAAQQAVAKDREYVDGIAADVEQAVRDVATDMLTPQVVTEAVERATEEAQAHASAAAESAAQSAESATESARQANLAKTRADRAEAARAAVEDAAGRAETAAETAKGYAEKLETGLAEQQRIAEMATQITRLADRVTKVELDHARGVEGGGGSATENVMPPEGIELSPGVRLSAITIVESGREAPEEAAVKAFVSDFAGA